MAKPVLLVLFLVALTGCQATSEANIDPQLHPVGQVRAASPDANPYLKWQRGF